MKNQIIELTRCYMPKRVSDELCKMDDKFFRSVRELRFKINAPLLVDNGNGLNKLFVGNEISFEEISQMVSKITRGSMYSVNDTIVQGFVTVLGGCRVGFCGTNVQNAQGILHIKDISAICFRINRQVIGCSIPFFGEILDGARIKNILFASPPGCGKTTLITDLCRVLGNGTANGKLYKVGIADERGEIAAVCGGVPCHDIGIASFVCDGYKKSQSIQMMLRSMSPQVIVTDEIGNKEDFDSVICAQKSGVSVIATAHAYSIDDLYFKYTKELIDCCFESVIFLSDKCGISKIYGRDKE